MKKTGVAFIIIGNLLHICSGMKMRIKETTAGTDDSGINMEVEREVSCPRWIGIPFILAGGIIYLAGKRK